MIHRTGLAMSLPPGSDTEQFSHAATPPSTTFDAAFDDNAAASSNGERPTKVCDFLPAV